MTGSILIALAVVLLLFVRMPVTVLAAVLMATVGATLLREPKPRIRCPNCGRRS